MFREAATLENTGCLQATELARGIGSIFARSSKSMYSSNWSSATFEIPGGTCGDGLNGSELVTRLSSSFHLGSEQYNVAGFVRILTHPKILAHRGILTNSATDSLSNCMGRSTNVSRKFGWL